LSFTNPVTSRLGLPPALPSADRMTYQDVTAKTVTLFAVMLAAATVSWLWTMSTVTPDGGVSLAPYLVGLAGGFATSLMVIFSKKVRPGLILTYGVFEGLFVGGISAYFEVIWPGVVSQAVLATLAVTLAVLILFSNGKVRTTPALTRAVFVAMLGYLVFSLANLLLSWTGAIDGTFGMRSMEVAGIPLGLVIGGLAVLLASYFLVMDFEEIQEGVRVGRPREEAWLGAFGLMLTLVWMYVEMLRIIAIIRDWAE